MKRIITILLFSCLAILTKPVAAQTVFAPAKDTATNAETVDLTLKVPGTFTVCTVQLDITKLTGTTAGTAFLQGSVNGTGYNTVPGTDTLTLANASATKFWVLNKSNFLYYRIRTVATGSQSTSLVGTVLTR